MAILPRHLAAKGCLSATSELKSTGFSVYVSIIWNVGIFGVGDGCVVSRG